MKGKILLFLITKIISVWVQIFFLHYNTYAKHVPGSKGTGASRTQDLPASRTQDPLAGHIIGQKQSSNQDYLQMPSQVITNKDIL